MLPSGLFVESPEMNDVSLHKLDQDVESWPEEILQRLKERCPQSNGLNATVKFMKKDDENGVATGSINVSSASKSAMIPIIIKDFYLYPLDVMVADQKLLPLTPDYFGTVFQGNNPFIKLEEFPMYSGLHRFEDASLWQANYPPGQGRYAYASAGYEILDKIAETIDPTEFTKYLRENPAVAANFFKHGQSEIVKIVSHLKPVNTNNFRESAEKLIPRNLSMLRLEGPNKYSVISNADSVFSPTQTAMNRHQFQDFVSKISDCVQDTMNEVDQNGEKIVYVSGFQEHPVLLATSHRENAMPADQFGYYRVMKKDGVSVDGVVIPKVIDFDQKLLPFKAFLGKTMGTIQTDIAGIKITNSDYKLRGQEPRTGQTGVFVYMPDQDRALCTMPVTITMIADDCGDAKMKVVDLRGNKFALRLGSYYAPQTVGGASPKEKIFEDSLQRIAKVADGYVLPKHFFWVPMDGFFEVSSNIIDYSTKLASKILTDSPVTVIPTGAGQYAVRGVTKYAKAAGWDSTNLEGWQTKFLLASLGMGSEKIAECLKVAGKVGQAELHGLNRPPLLEEKVAATLPAQRARVKQASDLRVNLIKEASYMDNAQTVDAMLALNFVNTDNLTKFIGFLPRLKATVSNLCSLLLASRLGVQEVPESAVSTAMYRLIDVINGLEQLRAAQEQGVQA